MPREINHNALTVIILSLILSGCGLTQEAHEKRVSKANFMPEEIICGQAMGLEYFTGAFTPVSSFTRNAAIESATRRNINCARYTDGLIRKNREGQESDSLERAVRRQISSERSASKEVTNLQREIQEMQRAEQARRSAQNTDCIMKGGIITWNGCSK